MYCMGGMTQLLAHQLPSITDQILTEWDNEWDNAFYIYSHALGDYLQSDLKCI